MELAPFTPYSAKPTADSRRAMALRLMNDTPETTELLAEGLLQIVAMEGPVLSTRAFNLYSKAGGMAKLTNVAVRRFSAALNKAKSEGRLEMELEPTPSTPGVNHMVAVLRLPTMKRIVVREYGNRGFDDIPAAELGEVMFEVATETGDDKAQLYQKMAEFYGLNHLPKHAEARLDFIYKTFLA